MIKVLLDTSICIYLIKRKPPEVLERFRSHSVGEIAVSSITVAELQYGAEKSRHVRQNKAALAQFLVPLVVLPFDEQAAADYGRIRALLEAQGTPIGALDLLIAAHARSLDLVLVTNDVRHCARVPDLQVVNWAA